MQKPKILVVRKHDVTRWDQVPQYVYVFSQQHHFDDGCEDK